MRRAPIPARSECALCLQAVKLCRSHILSKFLIKGTYADEGYALVKSALPGESTQKHQGGHWEHLLCVECEKRFGDLEDYARDVLVKRERDPAPGMPQLVAIRGIDYQRFKLFQMSLLWRISASRLPFYSRVDLGPIEEELRVMLLAGDPGEPWQFGCLMAVVTMQDGTPAHALVEPTPANVNGYRKVKFVAGGYTWIYSVSRRPHGLGSKGHLRLTGELYLTTTDLMDLPLVHDMTTRIVKKDLLAKFKIKPPGTSVLR